MTQIETFIDGLFPPENAPSQPAPTGRTVQEQAEYEEAKKDTSTFVLKLLAQSD